MNAPPSSGYVGGLADSFAYGGVAKYGRADHPSTGSGQRIRTRPHWYHGQPVVPNGLQEEEHSQ